MGSSSQLLSQTHEVDEQVETERTMMEHSVERLQKCGGSGLTTSVQVVPAGRRCGH